MQVRLHGTCARGKCAPQCKAHLSGGDTFPVSILFIDIPRVIVHVPVLRFLLVAHALFPEQVVAIVIIIGDGHVEGTTWVLVMIQPPLCGVHSPHDDCLREVTVTSFIGRKWVAMSLKANGMILI